MNTLNAQLESTRALTKHYNHHHQTLNTHTHPHKPATSKKGKRKHTPTKEKSKRPKERAPSELESKQKHRAFLTPKNPATMVYAKSQNRGISSNTERKQKSTISPQAQIEHPEGPFLIVKAQNLLDYVDLGV